MCVFTRTCLRKEATRTVVGLLLADTDVAAILTLTSQPCLWTRPYLPGLHRNTPSVDISISSLPIYPKELQLKTDVSCDWGHFALSLRNVTEMWAQERIRLDSLLMPIMSSAHCPAAQVVGTTKAVPSLGHSFHKHHPNQPWHGCIWGEMATVMKTRPLSFPSVFWKFLEGGWYKYLDFQRRATEAESN